MKKVKWVPNSLVLSSAGYDDTIKFWVQEDDDWVCTATLKGHESTVWDLDFTKDGNFLASTSDDATIKIWTKDEDSEELPRYSLITTLQGYHTRTVYSCSWNYDDTLLATVIIVYISRCSECIGRSR